MTEQVTRVDVRGLEIQFHTHTRSLELCARMNYETENLDFIDAIPKGSLLIDLGACEGRFSVYAALKGLEVIAFEPEKMNFDVLTQNATLNGIAGAGFSAVNAGVGSADGEAMLQIGQPWAGGHQKVVQHQRVRQDLQFDYQTSQPVQIRSLDHFLDDVDTDRHYYLKIDIDGSELPFLDGAERTLKDPNLRGIIFELDKADAHFNDIVGRLERVGLEHDSEYPVPNEPTLFNIIFRRK